MKSLYTLSQKIGLVLFALLFGAGLLFSIQPQAFAQAPATNTPNTAGSGDQGLVPCGSFSDNPCTVKDVFTIIVTVTNFLIGVAGIVAVVVIVFAGYSMVAAAGNAEALTSAKGLLVNAIIGFFLVMAAFAIANFLVFGGRAGFIKGDCNIISDPIGYIRQTCKPASSTDNKTDGTSTTDPTDDTAFLLPRFNYDGISSGTGAGNETAAVLPPTDSCMLPIQPKSAWWPQLFKIAQAADFNCDPAKGYMAGPQNARDFPPGIYFQQLYPRDLGYTNYPIVNGRYDVKNGKFVKLDTYVPSGCGLMAMTNALRYMILTKGHNTPGAYLTNNGFTINDVLSAEWLINVINKQPQDLHYFVKTDNGGAVSHNGHAAMIGRGNIIADVMAEQITTPSQWLPRINAALDLGGVAIVNTQKTNGVAIFTSGGHYVLVWRKYTYGGKTWYSVADSNEPRQIGQVRADILQASIKSSLTIVYPFSN